LLIVTCFCTRSSYAQQVLLEPSYIAPSGYYSYLLKPGVLTELSYKIGFFNGKVNVGLSLGYTVLQPTKDTFRTYGWASGTFEPGYEVIHAYRILAIGVPIEYVPLHNRRVSPVAGCDFYFYILEIAEDDYTQNVGQYYTTGDNFWLEALCPHVGVQYKINDQCIVTSGLGRSISFNGTTYSQAFWKTYISIAYVL